MHSTQTNISFWDTSKYQGYHGRVYFRVCLVPLSLFVIDDRVRAVFVIDDRVECSRKLGRGISSGFPPFLTTRKRRRLRIILNSSARRAKRERESAFTSTGTAVLNAPNPRSGRSGGGGYKQHNLGRKRYSALVPFDLQIFMAFEEIWRAQSAKHVDQNAMMVG